MTKLLLLQKRLVFAERTKNHQQKTGSTTTSGNIIVLTKRI
jgi:hypothetical protein